MRQQSLALTLPLVLLCYGIEVALLPTPSRGEEPMRLRIIHTNDLHSSRRLQDLAEFIHAATEEGRAQQRLVLKFDAGDFYSGTLDSLPALEDSDRLPIELAFFESLTYDAITIGNHEFDPGLFGFNRILHKAERARQRGQFKVPIVASTLHPALLASYPSLIFPSKIIERSHNGARLRLGIVGAMGKTALKGSEYTRTNLVDRPVVFGAGALRIAPLERLEFLGGQDYYVGYLQQAIDRVRSQVDLVIVLFHGGTHELTDREDADLIANLGGVDMVIAGHTHDSYFKTYRDQSRMVPYMQAGSSGRELGVLDLSFSRASKEHLTDLHHELRPLQPWLDQQREKAPFLGGFHQQWRSNKNAIDGLLGMEACRFKKDDSPIAQFQQSYAHKLVVDDLFSKNVISTVRVGLNIDAIVKAKIGRDINLYFSAIDLSLRSKVAGGIDYSYGEIVEAIAGSGFFTWFDNDGEFRFRHGFPIVSFYLTGYEISTLLSALVGTSRDMAEATPVVSRNVSLVVQERSLIRGRLKIAGEIKDLTIDGAPIEAKKLYHVATNVFIAENIFLTWAERTKLGMLTGIVRWFIGIAPKDAQGTPYNLSDKRIFQKLGLAQYLPTEYQAFAERFADNCGSFD